MEVWPSKNPQNNQIKEAVNSCLLTEQLGVSARQKGELYVLACKSEVPPWYGILDIGLLHTQQNKNSNLLATSLANFWFGFVVWLRDGCMNLEDVPPFFSLCLPFNKKIAANCWPRCSLLSSLGCRSDSDLILSLLSDVYILLDPPGPCSLALWKCFFGAQPSGRGFAGHEQWGWTLWPRSPGCLRCSGVIHT